MRLLSRLILKLIPRAVLAEVMDRTLTDDPLHADALPRPSMGAFVGFEPEFRLRRVLVSEPDVPCDPPEAGAEGLVWMEWDGRSWVIVAPPRLAAVK